MEGTVMWTFQLTGAGWRPSSPCHAPQSRPCGARVWAGIPLFLEVFFPAMLASVRNEDKQDAKAKGTGCGRNGDHTALRIFGAKPVLARVAGLDQLWQMHALHHHTEALRRERSHSCSRGTRCACTGVRIGARAGLVWE